MEYYENQTYYDILGVEQTASLSSIEKAKDRLKFGGPEDRAPFAMWAKIDEAYSVLSDSKKRAEYDNSLKTILNEKKESTPEISSSTQIEDIYSNSDHIIHSVVDEDKPIISKEKLKRIGKTVILALPMGAVATIQIIKELKKENEYKLQQDTEEKEIKEVRTEESKLEEIYREKLEKSIERKLKEYHFNYDLEIDKLRYQNHIELLKEKISLKENQVVKKYGLLKYKLELTSLKNQLREFEKNLEIIEQKIIDSKQSGKKSRLTTIYEKLIQVENEIKELDSSPVKKTIALKKLQLRRDKFKEKLKFRIDKVKSKRATVAIFKDSFIMAKAVTENFIDNLFVPIDEVDERIIKR